MFRAWTFIGIVILACCAQPIPAAAPAAAEPAPAPPSAPAPTSEATARADALIEDLRRREAAEADEPTTSGAQDELWWKNRVRGHQLRFQENIDRARLTLARMKAAKAQSDYDRLSAEADRYLAEAKAADDELEQLRGDGRRANVPPAWLRWP